MAFMPHAVPKSLAISLAGIVLFGGWSDRPQVTTRTAAPGVDRLASRLALSSRVDPQTGLTVSEGTFAVPEDRSTGNNRLIHLGVFVIRARNPKPKADPLFVFAGGPGADVTRSARGHLTSWIAEDRDIVLVSQRGTGGDNRLSCPAAVDDANPQGYLDPLFREDIFRPCLRDLQAKFDLTRYSTVLAADDYDEVRQALGYDRVNVTGGSYGTRMALVYMRQHPKSVRSAMLNGVVPLANKNPLYHAAGFDLAIRGLIAECAADPDCKAAVPNLDAEFRTILTRLDAAPASTVFVHPARGRVPVTLSRAAFLEALRVMMYSGARNRMVPILLHRAYQGDFEPFATLGVSSERSLRQNLAVGHLLSVTCAEDVDRITETEIVKVARGTLAGESRVREQKHVCSFWPRSTIASNYGDPVGVGVPTLLLSGTLDPVTPPRWGDEAARHLPNSRHVVVPGAHGVSGSCVTGIQKQFLEAGAVTRLDVSCASSLKPDKFQLAVGRQAGTDAR